MATRLAKEIQVVRRGLGSGQPVMVIDGEEFPYFTEDGYHVNVTRLGTPGVTITIAAERVEVIDDTRGIVPSLDSDGEYVNTHDAVLATVLPVGA